MEDSFTGDLGLSLMPGVSAHQGKNFWGSSSHLRDTSVAVAAASVRRSNSTVATIVRSQYSLRCPAKDNRNGLALVSGARSSMDFYGLYGSSPRLGLEEGQARLNCPPGTVKVYIQEFPWEKCVPESEILEPAPPELIEEPPVEEVPALPVPVPIPEAGPPSLPEPEPEPVPEPVPEPQPKPEPEYRPPGKARFLDIDRATGEIVDPDTGAPLPIVTAFSVTSGEGIATGVGVLAVAAVVLTALGVFRG